jgi:ethanolamine utilization microcompartment shell protein EutS
MVMHSFALSRHRRANVWLDEAPPADFAASSTVTRMVMPKVVVHPSRRIAGVEINITHGPKASYALLGAELVESNVDGLEVIVSVGAKGLPFAPSIALKPDDVKTGLLDEYAGAVVAGIERVAESSALPANVSLRFRWAAYGLVGSSSSVFADVSGFVARLLTLPKDASDQQVEALLG